jgi:bifunctional non-homologous end joining protein LigD
MPAPEVTEAKKSEEYIPAMLAKETDKSFSDKDWLYEIKWDGYRAIAEVNKGDVKLYSRNGNSFLSAYPDLVEELSKMKLNAVIDGEIVVLNEQGNPDFHKLQEYGINKDFPLQYYVFDLLELNGKKLYVLPLIERKKLLSEIIEKNAVIKYSDHIEERGEDFFAAIKEKNLEGIMAKRMDSKYFPGKRTTDWLKIKHHTSEEAIIAGFTAPRGGRKYFGALVLGTMINGKLTYAGHTGTGFNGDFLKEIFLKLQPLIRQTSPFSEKVKTNMPVTWVEPRYVCEVKFSEWTSDGKLRHPVFVRLREDKEAKDINTQPIIVIDENSDKINSEEKNSGKKIFKKASIKKVNSKKEISEEIISKGLHTEKENPEENLSAEEKAADLVKSEKVKTGKNATPAKEVVSNEKEKIYKFGKNELKTTNRTKIFFPEEGVTKGDVLDYYDQMSDLIIPYLKDRPQSLFRTPTA